MMQRERNIQFVLAGGVFTFLFGLSVAVTPDRNASTLLVAQTILPTGSSVETNTTDPGPVSTTEDQRTQEENTTASAESTVTESTVAEPSPTYVACPFSPQANRTRIDFTKGGTIDVASLMLVAHLDAKRATRSFALPSPLPAGTYSVHLASYDDHAKDTVTEYREEWSVTLFGGDGKRLYESPPIRDLKNTETLAIERVATDVPISVPVYKAVARHAAYPDSVPNSVAPLCVALDLIVPLSVVEEVSTKDTTDTTGTDATSVPGESAITTETAPVSDVPLGANCPIPHREGRVIADFTNAGSVLLRDLSVRADGTKVDATRTVAHTIPRGKYDIRIASHRVAPVGKGEVWHVMLFGTDGMVFARTPASRDIPAWETVFVSRVAESFLLSSDVIRVAGVHALYPSREATPVGVLCVAFDRVGDVPVQHTNLNEPVPTASIPPPTTEAEPFSHTLHKGDTTPLRPTHETLAKPMPENRSVDVAPTPHLTPTMREAREMVVREYGIEPFVRITQESQRNRVQMVETLLAHHESLSFATTTMPVQLTRAVVEGVVVHERERGGWESAVQAARERGGLAVLRDSDGDGISDYDEMYIYGTDPHNPFTAGSVLSDGERVLLGLDARSSDMTTIAVESAREVKTDVDTRLIISEVTYVPTVRDEGVSSGAVRVVGQAQPFMFVTLYLYSTPIVVTVRADVAGRFEYTFEEKLSDGSHEIYVTKVDNAGHILLKSAPIPFVKTAEAVSFTPPVSVAGPVDGATRTSLAFLLMAVLLLGGAMIVGLGIWKTHHITPGT